MKKLTIKKSKVSKAQFQILQNQGAIMLTLKDLIDALLKDNFRKSLMMSTLEETIERTGNIMQGKK